MFCPNCGNEVIDGVCKQCGCSLNFTLNKSNKDSTQVENIKSETEYLSEYHSRHKERIGALIVSILLNVIGTVLIIINIVELSNSNYIVRLFKSYYYSQGHLEDFTCVFIGVLCYILGSIFILAVVEIEINGKKEYKNYLLESQKTKNNERKINFDEWQCPACGIVNKNFVGTCGCGEVKPK